VNVPVIVVSLLVIAVWLVVHGGDDRW